MTMLSFGHRRNTCVHFRAQALALSIALSTCGRSQAQQSSLTELNAQIDLNQRLIRVAEHDRLSDAKQASLWAQLASDYVQLADLVRAEDAYFHAIHLLENAPDSRANYATVLDNMGVLYLAYNRKNEAKVYLHRALTMRKALGDSMRLGVSQVHLAQVALADHKFKEAENRAAEAQANLTAVGDSGKTGLVAALIALTYARCSQNKCAEGLSNVEQAMELARVVYPSDTLPVGHILMAIGFAKWKSGDNQEAEKMMVQGIHIITTQNAPGAPYSRNALFEYRSFLEATHRPIDVKRVDDQIASMATQPCANCTVSVYSLSNALR
jgi:tetratricopeptide (TPR) repeat protein